MTTRKTAKKPAAVPGRRHSVTTDAGIVTLFDAAHFPSIVDQESWEAALVDDASIAARIAKGHLVPLSAGSDGRFVVDVVIGDALEPADTKTVTRTSAPYLLVVEKAATLGGLEFVHASPDPKTTSPVALAPGRWAITLHQTKGKAAADVLVLARALNNGETLTGRTAIEPFDPEPTKPLGKLETLEDCQRAALLGRVDDAIPVLVALADQKNDVQAAAALAEIHAYRDEWPAFLDRALAVYARSREVLGNTTNELTWLLAVAARATGAWDRLARVVSTSSTMVADKNLRALIETKGAGPGVPLPPDLRYRDQPIEVRRSYYDKAMDPAVAKKRDKTPEAARASDFAYAFGYGLDELALEKLPAAEPHLSWDRLRKAAGWLVELGRPDDAWALIERALPKWHPLSYAQIVPLELLVDERLRPLLTAERRAAILAMPRGGAS